MRRIVFFAAIAFALVSCSHISGSGNIITEKRNVESFKGITVGGAFEVEVKNGPTTEVVVEADDNLMKNIRTEVNGGVLEISTRDKLGFIDGHFKVYVTAPEIKMLKASGAANIKGKSVLKTDSRFEMESSGASDVTVEVDAPEVETNASGASKISVSGRTRKHNAEASGSSDIKAGGLLSEDAGADASGASSIHVFGSVNIKADASGASNIYYKGGGAVVQKSSGASDVKKED